MHYLIDAYNLLFYITHDVQPIEQTREDLIHSLATDLTRLKLKATLVFDSGFTYQTHFPHKHSKSAIHITFSPEGMSADDYIIELLNTASHDTTVVTSDRDLSNQCTQKGFKTLSIENFYSYLQRRHKKITSSSAKHINHDPSYEAYLEKIFEERLNQM